MVIVYKLEDKLDTTVTFIVIRDKKKVTIIKF
jgi:hypothetical protein